MEQRRTLFTTSTGAAKTFTAMATRTAAIVNFIDEMGEDERVWKPTRYLRFPFYSTLERAGEQYRPP